MDPRVIQIMEKIYNMNNILLHKWENNIYTNDLLIDKKCKKCEICTKYLFLIEEKIITDNCLGIEFLNNHIHLNDIYINNKKRSINNIKYNKIIYF